MSPPLPYPSNAFSAWRRTCAALVLGFIALSSSTTGAQRSGAEYRLKAAIVSKFPQFAEWPAAALEGRDAIELCVAQPNPFGSALADLVTGETLHGRPLVTREVDRPDAIDTCHLLFVPELPPPARRALLSRAATLPVLTVGDHRGFLDEGGVVHLRVVDGRVRFDVSLTAANRAGVRLSSQLLRLALDVRGGPS